MNNKELNDLIWAYGLKNSTENNGIPDKERIYKSIIGHLKRINETDIANRLIKEYKEYKSN